MRLAFDTNVMAYAEGLAFTPADRAKHATALQLIKAAAAEDIVIALQALAELQRLLVRKAGASPAEASLRVRTWAVRAELAETGQAVFDAALDLAAAHGLQIFDAIILAAAAEARCELLLSEDLQDGFTWRGVTVADPFAAAPEPRLARLLAAAP